MGNEFMRLVAQEGQKYFWTGGNVNHGRNPSVSWPSGRTTSSSKWSNTGSANRPPLTTARATSGAWPSSTTSTTTASSSTTSLALTGNRSSVRPKHAHYGPQPLPAPPPLDLHTEENDTYIYICA